MIQKILICKKILLVKHSFIIYNVTDMCVVPCFTMHGMHLIHARMWQEMDKKWGRDAIATLEDFGHLLLFTGYLMVLDIINHNFIEKKTQKNMNKRCMLSKSAKKKFVLLDSYA